MPQTHDYSLQDLAERLDAAATLIGASELPPVDFLDEFEAAESEELRAVGAAAARLIATVHRSHALEAAAHDFFEALGSHLRLDYLCHEALHGVLQTTGGTAGAVVLLAEAGPDVAAAVDFDEEVAAAVARQAAAVGLSEPETLAGPGGEPLVGFPFNGVTGLIGIVVVEGVALTGEVRRLLALFGRALGFATDNALAHASLEARAATDPLTGCQNRRSGMAAVEGLARAAAHGGPPLSVLMVDLDRFKRINDDRGHQAGDDVLRAVGQTVAATVRASDIAMRYGGEEFLIAVATVDERGLAQLAERLRRAIELLRVPGEDGEVIPVTASVGAARWQGPGDGLSALIGRADAALYVAKEAGRNRVVIA
ncbi:MAG TPA: GGDEF domain-containing protein [Solirubrobacteraceae bacterium]